MRGSQEHVAKVRRQLRTMALIDVDRELLEQAGTVAPPDLRSLDAIHVAVALSLGDDLGDLVTLARGTSAFARRRHSVARCRQRGHSNSAAPAARHVLDDGKPSVR